MDKLEFANLLYEQYKEQWDISSQEFLKRKYAREKSEFDRIKRSNNYVSKPIEKKSCLHFYWKKYESFEQEQEYWEVFYKQQREYDR